MSVRRRIGCAQGQRLSGIETPVEDLSDPDEVQAGKCSNRPAIAVKTSGHFYEKHFCRNEVTRPMESDSAPITKIAKHEGISGLGDCVLTGNLEHQS